MCLALSRCGGGDRYCKRTLRQSSSLPGLRWGRLAGHLDPVSHRRACIAFRARVCCAAAITCIAERQRQHAHRPRIIRRGDADAAQCRDADVDALAEALNAHGPTRPAGQHLSPPITHGTAQLHKPIPDGASHVSQTVLCLPRGALGSPSTGIADLRARRWCYALWACQPPSAPSTNCAAWSVLRARAYGKPPAPEPLACAAISLPSVPPPPHHLLRVRCVMCV